MSRKSKRTNPLVIDMTKGNVHVELILWPATQVKIVADDDVGWYEIHPVRMAEPFLAVSEICHEHGQELDQSGKFIREVELLKELESITSIHRMFPVDALKAAGWTIPDFRRLEIAA